MVQRWELYDASVPETYVFPYNPKAMASIHRPRNITARTTTAVDGQALTTEGNPPPHSWNFSGTTRDSDHYAALLDWVYRPRRIRVTDHFGRTFLVEFQNFEATPERKVSNGGLIYWWHEYTVSGFIVSIPTAPTVGLAS